MTRPPQSSTTEAIYGSIVSCLVSNHHSPTVREIASIVGCSISTVHRHLQLLEERGLLRRRPGLARALVVVSGASGAATNRRRGAGTSGASSAGDELLQLLAEQAAAFERRGEMEAAQIDERLRVHQDVVRALHAACFHGYALGVRWAAEQLEER